MLHYVALVKITNAKRIQTTWDMMLHFTNWSESSHHSLPAIICLVWGAVAWPCRLELTVIKAAKISSCWRIFGIHLASCWLLGGRERQMVGLLDTTNIGAGPWRRPLCRAVEGIIFQEYANPREDSFVLRTVGLFFAFPCFPILTYLKLTLGSKLCIVLDSYTYNLICVYLYIYM